MRPFQKIIASVVVAMAIGAPIGVWQAGTDGGSSPPPGPGASWYINPSGSDSNPGTAGSPFQTMNKCYQAATPGDTCYLQSGSYGTPIIAYSSRKALSYKCRAQGQFYEGGGGYSTVSEDHSGCIKFMPAPGASPVLTDLTVNAPYVWIYGLTFSLADQHGSIDIQNQQGAGGSCQIDPDPFTDIIIDSVSAANFQSKCDMYTSIINSTFNEINYVNGAVSSTVNPATGSPGVGQNMGSRGGTMYYFQVRNNTMENYFQLFSTQHVECIHWWSADHVSIDGNRFLNCGGFGVAMQGDSDVEKYVLAQNNIFDEICSRQVSPCVPGEGHGITGGPYPAFVGYDDHYMYRFNSCAFDDYCPSLNVFTSNADLQIIGNAMGFMNGAQCGAWLGQNVSNIDYNFYYNGATSCGSHAQANSVSTIYNDPTNWDFTVKAGLSPTPVNMIPTSAGCPPTDAAGVTRPQGTNCDAGGYERDGS